jgi:hypothetical protein
MPPPSAELELELELWTQERVARRPRKRPVSSTQVTGHEAKAPRAARLPRRVLFAALQSRGARSSVGVVEVSWWAQRAVSVGGSHAFPAALCTTTPGFFEFASSSSGSYSTRHTSRTAVQIELGLIQAHMAQCAVVLHFLWIAVVERL